MYSGDSVDPEISPIPSLIFTREEAKRAKFGVIFDITQLSAVHVWKCSKISELWNTIGERRWSPFVLYEFSEVGSTHLWESSEQSAPHRKIGQRKCAKSSITPPRIMRFRSSFCTVWTHDPRNAVKDQGQRGQRSWSQRDLTGSKISKIINNSARDCSISLKCRTDFDQMAFDVLQVIKINGSKVKVTEWHNVIAAKIVTCH